MSIPDQSVKDSSIRKYKVNQSPTVNPWPISQSSANHPILDQSINSLQIPSIQCHTDQPYRSTESPFLSYKYQSQSSKLDRHRFGTHWHRSCQSYVNRWPFRILTGNKFTVWTGYWSRRRTNRTPILNQKKCKYDNPMSILQSHVNPSPISQSHFCRLPPSPIAKRPCHSFTGANHQNWIDTHWHGHVNHASQEDNSVRGRGTSVLQGSTTGLVGGRFRTSTPILDLSVKSNHVPID